MTNSEMPARPNLAKDAYDVPPALRLVARPLWVKTGKYPYDEGEKGYCPYAAFIGGVQASKLVIDAKDLIFGHFDRDDRPTIS